MGQQWPGVPCGTARSGTHAWEGRRQAGGGGDADVGDWGGWGVWDAAELATRESYAIY